MSHPRRSQVDTNFVFFDISNTSSNHMHPLYGELTPTVFDNCLEFFVLRFHICSYNAHKSFRITIPVISHLMAFLFSPKLSVYCTIHVTHHSSSSQKTLRMRSLLISASYTRMEQRLIPGISYLSNSSLSSRSSPNFSANQLSPISYFT